MQPLSPRDLLIRKQPDEVNPWESEEESRARQAAVAGQTVSLERFQALEHVIRDNPLTVDPYLELARIYMGESRWSDAKRVLDLAVVRFAEDEQVNFLREEAQLRRSLQLLHAADAEHAADPSAASNENVERCRVQMNVLRQQICEARLARHPEQIELNIDLALALENLGQRDEAIRAIQIAVAEPRLRAAAALQLGHLYARAKQIPKALSAYRRAALFRSPPPSAEIKLAALNAAANLAEKSRMVDSARRYVGMLVELQPDSAEHKTRLERLRQTPL